MLDDLRYSNFYVSSWFYTASTVWCN